MICECACVCLCVWSSGTVTVTVIDWLVMSGQLWWMPGRLWLVKPSKAAMTAPLILFYILAWDVHVCACVWESFLLVSAKAYINQRLTNKKSSCVLLIFLWKEEVVFINEQYKYFTVIISSCGKFLVCIPPWDMCWFFFFMHERVYDTYCFHFPF